MYLEMRSRKSNPNTAVWWTNIKESSMIRKCCINDVFWITVLKIRTITWTKLFKRVDLFTKSTGVSKREQAMA